MAQGSSLNDYVRWAKKVHLFANERASHVIIDKITTVSKRKVADHAGCPDRKDVRCGVTTGGVCIGNVNVEAIQFAGQKDDRPRLVGFGFEAPPLKECFTELDRRGITYGQLRAVVSTAPNGSRNTLWTNVTLTPFSDSDSPADATIHIVVTEYSPTYVNVAERRAVSAPS